MELRKRNVKLELLIVAAKDERSSAKACPAELAAQLPQERHPPSCLTPRVYVGGLYTAH